MNQFIAITACLFVVMIALLTHSSKGLASNQVLIGEIAPKFELPDQNGKLHSLDDYRDQWVVLYFYPKDDTPGCTTQACDFRDNIFDYRDLNAQILGVSLDDVASHKEFEKKYGLPFPILADVEGLASEAYGVKTSMLGIDIAKRQTFIISPSGAIAKHYEKVNISTHSDDVLSDLKKLVAGN